MQAKPSTSDEWLNLNSEVKARLAAAREQCDKATAGPWYADWIIDGPDGDDLWFVQIDNLDTVIPACGISRADAHFIAAARTGWPAALDILLAVLDEHEAAERTPEPAAPYSVVTWGDATQADFDYTEAHAAWQTRLELRRADVWRMAGGKP